ncbi:ATP-dependent protease ATPase subunit HslU [Candidatus Hepatincola sp. Pdp]
MKNFTPQEIVSELDKHIVGQDDAKKLVAIALRNRWRRKQLANDLQKEVMPKNILMIGSTGVGKTEIARRLAKLDNAPFVKVEATKFTEVGYVGRDVEQIIRDLVDIAIKTTKADLQKSVKAKAEKNAVDKVVKILTGSTASPETQQKFKEKVQSGELNNTEIEIKVKDKNTNNTLDIPGLPHSQIGIGMISLDNLLGKEKFKNKKVLLKDALDILIEEESEGLIDQDLLTSSAIYNVENHGIVFLDEIDKIASSYDRRGADVSREGVQRDLLPLVEGTIVNTKYGVVNTSHILFIASGAFHLSKPSDLLPELQGRFPTRVELHPLSKADFKKILTEPQANLILQYTAMLATEDVHLTFDMAAIDEIARLTEHFNHTIENIGARRLHTILEKLLEDINFNASKNTGKKIKITKKMVNDTVGYLEKDLDLSKFII